MKKDIQKYIELSEEQLREIAGGCTECDGIRSQLTQARNLMNDSARQYNLAVAERRYNDAATHYTTNMQQTDRVTELLGTLERTIARLHLPAR